MSHPVPSDQVGLPDHAHEESDVSIRGIGIFLAGMVLGLAATAVVLFWLFHIFEQRALRVGEPITAIDVELAPPPAPRLQADPAAELRALRSRQQAQLESYQWIDRDAGVVRIPIETAIDRLAEEGMPE